MRIGIDARELCGNPTGVGRYLGGLLAAWAEDARAQHHEFVLYAPQAPSPLAPDTGGRFVEVWVISSRRLAARNSIAFSERIL